jgi:hypothetical protein
MRADGERQLVGILPERFSTIRAKFATALMIVHLQLPALWETFLGQLNKEKYTRLLAKR